VFAATSLTLVTMLATAESVLRVRLAVGLGVWLTVGELAAESLVAARRTGNCDDAGAVALDATSVGRG
jgi:hypothetical protein